VSLAGKISRPQDIFKLQTHAGDQPDNTFKNELQVFFRPGWPKKRMVFVCESPRVSAVNGEESLIDNGMTMSWAGPTLKTEEVKLRQVPGLKKEENYNLLN
jgi:hypothetical protein